MAIEFTEEQAQFSRRAAAMMNAPFWTRPHDEVPDDKVADWWDVVHKQRAFLRNALSKVKSYNDLPHEARKLFKEAESYTLPDDGGDLEDDE